MTEDSLFINKYTESWFSLLLCTSSSGETGAAGTARRRSPGARWRNCPPQSETSRFASAHGGDLASPVSKRSAPSARSADKQAAPAASDRQPVQLQCPANFTCTVVPVSARCTGQPACAAPAVRFSGTVMGSISPTRPAAVCKGGAADAKIRQRQTAPLPSALSD